MLESREQARARRKLEGREHDPLSKRLNMSAKPGTDQLPQIKHIIVLMQENHSYDNYFGMLQGRGEGFQVDKNGPVGANQSTDRTVVPLHHAVSTKQSTGVPTQTWNASHQQFHAGANDGFVTSIENTLPGRDGTAAMRYWTEEDIPFYYGLARTFPLATRWHGSCLGPTIPNRRFLIAGTAHGLIDDAPFNMADYPQSGTIFDQLDANGISWANYHNVKRWKIDAKLLLRARGMSFFKTLVALLPTVFKVVRSKVEATADLYPLGTLRSINHLRDMRQFRADCAAGTLPSVVFIDPDFGTTSEEDPQDISAGESFCAAVINHVFQGPGWAGTVLIWTYDEHGGYYDHVPPPAAVPPDDVVGSNPMDKKRWLRWILHFTSFEKALDMADGGDDFEFDRLGFRVPAVVVSPYARVGYETDTVFDHTSVLKLIEHKWNLPPLTARDEAANDPIEMLDLESAPAFAVPPDLPKARSASS